MGAPIRRRRCLLLTLLVLAAVLLDRLLVLGGSGHLLFDLNQAEQGFIRALSPWLDAPLHEILADPPRRARFLRDSQSVGNQAHGTLALAMAALQVCARLGVPLGTLTLRVLALLGSLLSLALWLRVLGRNSRGGWASILSFGALFLVAPPVMLKLGLVHWGTHEWVSLLFSGLIAAVAPGLQRPARRGLQLARIAAVGAVCAALLVANGSLLMPGLAVLCWLSLGLGAQRADPLPWRLLGPILGLVLGGLALFATLGALRSTGWLAGLGQPDGLWGEPLLVGKRGRPFLMPEGLSWREVGLWGPVFAKRAMPLVPGPLYGHHAATLEPLVRAGVGLLGLGLGLRGLWRRRGLAGFLGLYLVGGWLAVTLLGQTHGLDPGIVGGIQPRYYAHLYPVALALLALWAGRSWLGRLSVGAVLFLAWPDHRALWDLDQPWICGRLRWAADAHRLWLQEHSDRSPPTDRLRLGWASPAFLQGMGLVEVWQFTDYWRWHRPQSIGRRDLDKTVARFAEDKDWVDDPDGWRGLGRALGCLVPPGRAARLEPVWAAFPDQAPWMQEGLRGAP